MRLPPKRPKLRMGIRDTRCGPLLRLRSGRKVIIERPHTQAGDARNLPDGQIGFEPQGPGDLEPRLGSFRPFPGVGQDPTKAALA
jgi:hypothetical protein